MNLASENGFLNLAGVLLFAEKPEWIKSVFMVKAVSYPGNDIAVSQYLDSEDFCGPDHLPNNLTIEKITAGNSNIRNPILASFVAKKLLPYRGLGSRIRRSLEEWPDIDFFDDREGCTSKVVVHKKSGQDDLLNEAGQTRNKDLKVHLFAKNKPLNRPLNEPLNELQNQILNFIRTNPNASYEDVAGSLNKGRTTIMRNIQRLKDLGRLSRIGSKKSGHWKITP